MKSNSSLVRFCARLDLGPARIRSRCSALNGPPSCARVFIFDGQVVNSFLHHAEKSDSESEERWSHHAGRIADPGVPLLVWKRDDFSPFEPRLCCEPVTQNCHLLQPTRYQPVSSTTCQYPCPNLWKIPSIQWVIRTDRGVWLSGNREPRRTDLDGDSNYLHCLLEH